MTIPGLGQVPVVLRMNRSQFAVDQDGCNRFGTHSRGHAAYVNDSWTINKYVTVNAGIRWQQERMGGEQAQYTITGDWSTRIRVDIDPIGDRKNKIFFNFGRYSYNLPLDLAERSLTNEQDLSGFRLIPAFTVNGSGQRIATINQFGSVTPVVDAAHDVNLLAGGFPTTVPNASSGGNLEFIHSGTKLSYEDEYVFGAEHQFSHGVILTARYTRRSLRRIVEDTGGIAPEANQAGITQFFSITNPSKKLDIFTNPIQHDFVATTNAAGRVNNVPAACAPGDFVAFPITNSFGNPITDPQGNTAACFSEGLDASTGNFVPVGVKGCPATGACTPAVSPVSHGI